MEPRPHLEWDQNKHLENFAAAVARSSLVGAKSSGHESCCFLRLTWPHFHLWQLRNYQAEVKSSRRRFKPTCAGRCPGLLWSSFRKSVHQARAYSCAYRAKQYTTRCYRWAWCDSDYDTTQTSAQTAQLQATVPQRTWDQRLSGRVALPNQPFLAAYKGTTNVADFRRPEWETGLAI